MIERTEEMRLTALQEAEIANLMALCFANTDLEGRSFAQNRHHCRLAVHEDGALAGHLALAFRAIRLGDALHDIVGIAQVVVHPDHRRRGIASALVAAARTSPCSSAPMPSTRAPASRRSRTR